jgi:hypothetical protein
VAHGSWLMSILEDAGFGVRSGSGADLIINASVKTVDVYIETDGLEQIVQYSMIFQKILCPDYSGEEIQRLKCLLMDEIPKIKGYSEIDGKSKIKMVAWLSVVWKQDS